MNFKALFLSIAACLVAYAQAETIHFLNEVKDQRALLKADLMFRAQEIESQLYSEKQEQLWSYVNKGSVLALAGVLSAMVYYFYLYNNALSVCDNCAESKLLKKLRLVKRDEIIKMSSRDLDTFFNFKQSLVDKINSYHDEAHNLGAKFSMWSISALIPSIPAIWSRIKLEQQNDLKTKLEEIKQQIAELDAIDAD